MGLFAILHDGTFHGDSAFYFPGETIPFEVGMTLEAVKAAYIKGHVERLKKDGIPDEDLKGEIECVMEDLADVKGAVVVNEKVVTAMEAIWESDPGNDSAVYACNRASKRVAWTLKESHLGEEMR